MMVKYIYIVIILNLIITTTVNSNKLTTTTKATDGYHEFCDFHVHDPIKSFFFSWAGGDAFMPIFRCNCLQRDQTVINSCHGTWESTFCGEFVRLMHLGCSLDAVRHEGKALVFDLTLVSHLEEFFHVCTHIILEDREIETALNIGVKITIEIPNDANIIKAVVDSACPSLSNISGLTIVNAVTAADVCKQV